VGVTVTGVPEKIAPTPPFTDPLPLVNTPVRVTLLPRLMLVWLTVRAVIAGAAITAIVALPVALTPDGFVTVQVMVQGPGVLGAVNPGPSPVEQQ